MGEYLECALVLLVLLTFVENGSLSWVVYHPLGSTLLTASRFLAGSKEADLKPTPLSSLLLFGNFMLLCSMVPPWVIASSSLGGNRRLR